MARTMRECLTTSLKSEGKEDKPETNTSVPQQEEHSDAGVGKDIIDYDLDKDYEGSEPSQLLKNKRRRIHM